MAAVSRLDTCPLCLSQIPRWGCECPRCRYHPDRYNRAQDDVAMIFRLGAEDRSDPPETTAAPAATQSASPSGWFNRLWK